MDGEYSSHLSFASAVHMERNTEYTCCNCMRYMIEEGLVLYTKGWASLTTSFLKELQYSKCCAYSKTLFIFFNFFPFLFGKL